MENKNLLKYLILALVFFATTTVWFAIRPSPFMKVKDHKDQIDSLTTMLRESEVKYVMSEKKANEYLNQAVVYQKEINYWMVKLYKAQEINLLNIKTKQHEIIYNDSTLIRNLTDLLPISTN